MFSRSARIYDAIYATLKDFAVEAERVHQLVQARRPGAETLLDVACGTGAHLEHLSRHYDVAGVDIDPEMVATARERLPGLDVREADMVDFALGRRFDAVVCLFSSIAYVRTPDRLQRAVATMARHLEPAGVLVLEPWVLPEQWDPDPKRLHAIFVDEPELKVARVSLSPPAAPEQTLEFHYLVARPGVVESFTERHEVGMFTHEEYLEALAAARLGAEHDPDGLMGRGLYIGVRAA